MDTKKLSQNTVYPPVVAVLGHVDHGKTTLLDAIRKTSIADREFGGITQKIGASSIEIDNEGKKRWITFIDTPGHEAFSKMRGRGTQAADIGLLIISSVDGVMPQTTESISLLKVANIPYICVLTKVDMPTKQLDKVKQQLMKEGIVLEGYGGDVPVIEVSAKTNLHIKELLELILLVYDLQIVPTITKSATGEVEGVVIESKLDPRTGSRATVVIKNGTVHVRDELFCDGSNFKIRSLMNDRGKMLKAATIGEAIEIHGFEKVPSVGSVVKAKQDAIMQALQPQQLKRDLIYTKREKQNSRLNVIIVTDTAGALEAITYALPKEVEVIQAKSGEVNEADIILAKSTGALVLSFNTKIKPDVQKLAATEKVLAKNYQIIYEMLNEIADVIEGKRLDELEQVFGTARIQASFPFEKTKVLGIKVLDGRVARGDKARLMRGEVIVGESTIGSLRQGKNSTSKVEKGQEAGIIISPLLDFEVGDMLLCHD